MTASPFDPSPADQAIRSAASTASATNAVPSPIGSGILTPTTASMTSSTAWTGSKPSPPGNRTGDAPTATHASASATERADQAGQRGAVSSAEASRPRRPGRSATPVVTSPRPVRRRGPPGRRRRLAAWAISSMRSATATAAGLSASAAASATNHASREKYASRAAASGRPALARACSSRYPRISWHSGVDQPPLRAWSRLRPRSHHTRTSSGTFTTTRAATTHTASVSGLPAPATRSAAKLPTASTTRADATRPRMTPARGSPRASTRSEPRDPTG